MKIKLILGAVLGCSVFLTGCAESATPFNAEATSSRTPESGDSSNPPVTMSGYVDNGVTVQNK